MREKGDRETEHCNLDPKLIKLEHIRQQILSERESEKKERQNTAIWIQN
jgi:hypothetical protein